MPRWHASATSSPLSPPAMDGAMVAPYTLSTTMARRLAGASTGSMVEDTLETSRIAARSAWTQRPRVITVHTVDTDPQHASLG